MTEGRSPAERVVASSMVDETGVGKPLSERARFRQRSIESYLRGEMLPRYIQRLAEIERGTRRHERELARAYRDLRERHGADVSTFTRAWHEHVARVDFRAVNELVEQHNAWYPIERDLPMDPRTGDYVLVSGRPYQREPLSPAWALERFPPVPDDEQRSAA